MESPSTQELIMIENHSLALELPEYKDTIHRLKLSDAHFAKLFDEYHATDKEIHRIEQGAEVSSDSYIENLKKQRLHIKDTLFSMLRSA
jgi:uncharacterized protein YdcH (DUF465 family)